MGCSLYQFDETLLERGRNRRSPTVLSSPAGVELSSRVTEGIEQYLCLLRGLLLRMRVAGQLRQDVMVEKYFVELKDLCRGVCDEIGTASEVFEGLWAVVGRRRGEVANTTTIGRWLFLPPSSSWADSDTFASKLFHRCFVNGPLYLVDGESMLSWNSDDE